VLAESEFHTGKILHDKNFRRVLQKFCDMYGICDAAKLKVIGRR